MKPPKIRQFASKAWEQFDGWRWCVVINGKLYMSGLEVGEVEARLQVVRALLLYYGARVG